MTKDQKKDLRLSDTMWRGLRDLIEHGNPTRSCRGQSEHGGMSGAVRALFRRGLVEYHYQMLAVTEDGRKVYDARIEAARQARAQTEATRTNAEPVTGSVGEEPA